MSAHVVIVALVFMVGLVVPMVALTWYSMRSDHHTPPVLDADAHTDRS